MSVVKRGISFQEFLKREAARKKLEAEEVQRAAERQALQSQKNRRTSLTNAAHNLISTEKRRAGEKPSTHGQNAKRAKQKLRKALSLRVTQKIKEMRDGA